MNQQTNNEKPTTIGCPSIGVGRLPEGFDGVEPLERTDYESIISDVFHTCNEAFINAPHQREARPGYFKTVVGDLADALESVVPVEGQRSKVEGQTVESNLHCLASTIDNLTPEEIAKICERHGLKKRMTHAEYMTVAEGLKLTWFKGTNATRLVAVRKGRQGASDALYEILVDNNTATAVIERDGEMMYQIKTLGLSHRRCIYAAIQTLRAHLAENNGVHRRHRLSRQRRVGILTPEEEIAETVRRQKES